MKGHDVAINGHAGDGMARPDGHRGIPSRMQGGRGGLDALDQEEKAGWQMIKGALTSIVCFAGSGASVIGYLNSHAVTKFFVSLFQ